MRFLATRKGKITEKKCVPIKSKMTHAPRCDPMPFSHQGLINTQKHIISRLYTHVCTIHIGVVCIHIKPLPDVTYIYLHKQRN